ncbi:MAG: hypothetical protein QOC94_3056, partial [Actinoplanes sp.]|nr:hypothetical protein [Actinoplanes sp.]
MPRRRTVLTTALTAVVTAAAGILYAT